MDNVARSEWTRDGPDGASLSHLAHFNGPPNEFLNQLLSGQCAMSDSERGAIVRVTPDGVAQPLAIHPQSARSSTPKTWLEIASETARKLDASDAGTVVIALTDGDVDSASTSNAPPFPEPPAPPGDPLNHPPKSRHLLTIPIRGTSTVRGAAAFVIASDSHADFQTRRERLELSMQLLALYEMRLTLDAREGDLRQLKVAMEVIAAINSHDRFLSTAMAFCNEVASRWRGQRVGLGFLEGRYVVLKALSHTERFDRRTQLVQSIESTMEESLDQDVEIVHPASPDARYVCRTAAEFSAHFGPVSVCSLPIRPQFSTPDDTAADSTPQPRAVLTIDRPVDDPLDAEQVRTLRLTCDLCSARLLELFERDRWFGARAAESLRRGLAALVGPTHTWAKALAVLAVAAGLFLTMAKGQYRASGSFVIEPSTRQIVPAPFDGYLATVHVRIGDSVRAGETVMATLEAAELRLQLASARAEAYAETKRAALARRSGEEADAQISDALAKRVQAQIDLLEYKIDQADIRSATSGVVIAGDLERQLGAPFKTGDLLFEVTPLENLRAQIAVPEDQIADVRIAQTGRLATASFPGDMLPFTVEHINPMAEIVDGQNAFSVRVRLQELRPWLRPGMAGTGKIDIDRRSYLWIWTRRFVNWVRMQLWL